MRAMVLAAGHGTRLRPLTDDRPKALVEIRGRTLLEIALERLRNFGINDVMIRVKRGVRITNSERRRARKPI